MNKTNSTILMAMLLLVASVATAQPVDSWNADCIPDDGPIMGSPANYAMKYEPAQSYMLTRVDVWAGSSDYIDPDEITVFIQTDFDGQPSGEILGEALSAIPQGPPNWLGTDFDEPVFLEEGQTYWLVYYCMPWSTLPYCEDGDLIETWESFDQIHWDDANDLAWKAKFWGVGSVATESTTWDHLKSLYQ